MIFLWSNEHEVINWFFGTFQELQLKDDDRIELEPIDALKMEKQCTLFFLIQNNCNN